MSMETDLIAFVIADADVTALVGSRCFFQRIPQGQPMPAIRVSHISTTSEIHLNGVMGEARTVMQLDCYADTQAGSIDLAEKVRVALVANQNGRRVMGSTTVQQTRLVGKGDEPAFQVPGAGNKWRFNRSLDFELDYTEAATA